MKLVFDVPLGLDIGLSKPFKQDATLLAAGIGATVAGASALQSNVTANTNSRLGRDYARWAVHQQEAENERARMWQHGESDIARRWEEEMYNQYNSPSAMMRQYREAGLNPYLGASGQTGQGMGTAAPMQGPGASGISPASFNQYQPDLSGLSAIGRDLVQATGVSSQIANQQSQTLKNKLEAIRYAYDNFGPETARGLIKSLGIDAPDNMGLSNTQQIITADLMYKTQQTYKVQVEAGFIENFEKPKAEAMTKSLNKQVDEMQARIDLYKTQGRLNDAKAYEVGSEVARNFAQAGLFNAQSGQINTLLKYVRASAAVSLSVGLMDMYTQLADFIGDTGKRNYIMSPEGQSRREWNYKQSPEGNYVNSFMSGFMKNVPISVWQSRDYNFYQPRNLYNPSYIINNP